MLLDGKSSENVTLDHFLSPCIWVVQCVSITHKNDLRSWRISSLPVPVLDAVRAVQLTVALHWRLELHSTAEVVSSHDIYESTDSPRSDI